MTITTKYNIGDEVWFIFGGKPYKSRVLGIKVWSQDWYIYCVRQFQSSGDILEELLFPTKEELLKSL